ncbi:MAG: hypothetical protein Q9227_005582 [Pyrenula ochraceoflavens]
MNHQQRLLGRNEIFYFVLNTCLHQESSNGQISALRSRTYSTESLRSLLDTGSHRKPSLTPTPRQQRPNGEPPKTTGYTPFASKPKQEESRFDKYLNLRNSQRGSDFYRLDKQEFPHITLNEDIQASQIRIQTIEGLGPVTPLQRKLSEIDRSRFMIQEISKTKTSDVAICKLLSKDTYRVMTKRARDEEKKEFGNMTIDEDIRATFVRVKEKNSIPSSPLRMAQLLKETNREQFIIHQLSAPDESDTSIVRLIDKEQYRRGALERRLKEKGRKKAPDQGSAKKIEMNWTISQNDFNHKFKQLEAFLTKKKWVEIIITPKRKGRVVTRDEAATLLTNVKEYLTKMSVQETRSEGNVMGLMTILVHPKKS